MIETNNHHIFNIGRYIICMDGQCHKSFIKSNNEQSDRGYFLEVEV